MPSLRSLRAALRAASYLPTHQLLGHVRRRLRDRLVPLQAASYRRSLLAQAERLPPTKAIASPAAKLAADTVAMFFAAKHSKNVPQCFEGRYTFLNRTHDFGSAEAVDWCVDMDGGRYQLWRANLAFMGYLCPACDADPARGLALAATLARSMDRISTFSDRARFSDVWNSYPVAQRILAFAALLIRLPEELADHPDRIVVDAFLRFNVAYLLRNLETELGFNHLERNLSALGLYALAAQSAPEEIVRPLHAHFKHIVCETIGDDGVQLERSPMYQGYVVQSLRVLQELDIWTADQSAKLADRLGSVEIALAAMTLGDDRPAMFNDGWLDETPTTSTILGQYAVPGFVCLPDAGYVRLVHGDAVVLFDAGPIGADANPGHGHADFLSIEMSLGEDRFIVDPGTPTYAAGVERDWSRAWNAHNGPAVVGIEPVEYLGSFKVGRRVAAQLDGSGTQDDEQFARASLLIGKVGVKRMVRLGSTQLLVEDSWSEPSSRDQSRFLVPSEWQVTLSSDDHIMFSMGNKRVSCTAKHGKLALSAGDFSRRYNIVEPAHVVVAAPNAGALQLVWDWGN